MNRRNTWRLLAMLVSGVSAWRAPANGFGCRTRTPLRRRAARRLSPRRTIRRPSTTTPRASPSSKAQPSRRHLWNLSRSELQPPAAPRTAATPTTVPIHLAAVPQLFLHLHAAKGAPLSFGLGVYAPYGGKMSWPQDTGFRSVAISGSLTYLTINPVVAVKAAARPFRGRRRDGELWKDQHGTRAAPQFQPSQLISILAATAGARVTTRASSGSRTRKFPSAPLCAVRQT
jgi:hypothetical protein